MKITAAKSNPDKLPRLGAALAYYTVFSIVPMLIIIISVVGLAFGQDAAQGYIFDQLSSLLGEPSANAIREMIQRANQPSTGVIAAIIAFFTLMLGASGLFGELQDTINTIWELRRRIEVYGKLSKIVFFFCNSNRNRIFINGFTVN